jgi:hypothetical protein
VPTRHPLEVDEDELDVVELELEEDELDAAELEPEEDELEEDELDDAELEPLELAEEVVLDASPPLPLDDAAVELDELEVVAVSEALLPPVISAPPAPPVPLACTLGTHAFARAPRVRSADGGRRRRFMNGSLGRGPASALLARTAS